MREETAVKKMTATGMKAGLVVSDGSNSTSVGVDEADLRYAARAFGRWLATRYQQSPEFRAEVNRILGRDASQPAGEQEAA